MWRGDPARVDLAFARSGRVRGGGGCDSGVGERKEEGRGGGGGENGILLFLLAKTQKFFEFVGLIMCCLRRAIESASALHVNKPCACRCDTCKQEWLLFVRMPLGLETLYPMLNSVLLKHGNSIHDRATSLGKCHDKVKYKPTAQLSWGRVLFSCPFPLLSLIRYSSFAASARLQEERT